MNKATQLSSQNNTLNLDIEGMTCAACAARIERVISKQENVLDVSVSFPLKSAIVDIKNNEEFDHINIENFDGPTFIEVKVQNSSDKNLSRPDKTPEENKRNFMEKINNDPTNN